MTTTHPLLQIWNHANIAPNADSHGVIEDGALVVEADRIVWLGSSSELPQNYLAHAQVHDMRGHWITPGLIDCHTHLVYGGVRADEFAQRLAGVSYETIARNGGGIVSTVNATRHASEEALLAQTERRLAGLLAEGVTLVEIKSGYGLDLDSERKMLRVARTLGQRHPVTVTTTFLGAHALPPEYKGRADDYVDLVCNSMMPTLHGEGLIDAVDVFCENIGFTVSQTERIFETAQRLGLPVKVHAEQLSNIGATRLATRYSALSSDHLEYLTETDIACMQEAGTVAVLLPGAFYFLREKQLPPLDLLRAYQIPMAIATDSNPGTSPTTSLLLAMNMACTLFRMTVDEVLAGVTRHAARALGMDGQYGSLAVGRYADFAVWKIQTLSELAYWFGHNPCHQVVQHGKIVKGYAR